VVRITDKNVVRNALANQRLEGLSVSNELKSLLDRALEGEDITTEYLIKMIKERGNHEREEETTG